MTIIEQLARELNRPAEHIENVVRLLDEGNTIPFIARYRKELHGSMDDTALRTLEERLAYLRNLTERKESVKASIAEQEKLTDELAAAIDAAQTLAEVEDLYRPYKPKRRTRATVAKEKGLEPLAALLFAQERDCPRPEEAAADYLSAEKSVETVADALQGANDIVAEWISDDAAIRRSLRELLEKRGTLRSLAATEEDSVYRLYYDFEQPLSRLQGHQILAINRGEKEKLLSATVLLDRELALPLLRRAVVKPGSAAMEFVKAAAEDAYDRLIYPSLEREMRTALTDKASEGAIKMFALNLKPLLMQPPVKGHVTMGLDPGYAHGCKVAVIDATGKVLDTTVVYPTYGERQKNEAITKLAQLVKKHGVEHIAIGNGTASRETEQMTVELIHKVGGGLSYMIVSEAGASVYSASKLAAEEFPQFDVNLRSAVSIARRLQDPLAELVKIDPKAIGVGQYQHDMPQKELDASLNAVVEDCVNAVGVDLNTASPSLLTRVAGLNGTIAKNIVAFREENGVFTTRRQLLKVAKLGPKAFEQCAGFLRVPESKNVLDNTGVHPESYNAAKGLLELLGATPKDARDLPARLNAYGAEKAAVALGVGVPTLRDIAKELSKPGRDPRDELPAPILRTDVLDIKDLKPGMVLTGTVRNVIDFGVFVDIGVHQDGLVHISQVCNKFIKHPSEAVAVGDVVKVVVLDVDEKKHRISLSMKQVPKE
ncbi:Tex family protein [Oscillibacter sp. MSJ-31]|uniref:Tex family protein n=1 Tax=Oscillibacter sp. MSJ-31 TaxID=2841526 RepID=UPI001C12621D|nr:Tex family protein [Oscillibacter sp. MSJ-31]MBU5458202.1 RNA-binding transcriptional accessory protein [Oscillibacter sp. MSJ-31]